MSIQRSSENNREEFLTFLNQDIQLYRHLDWMSPADWVGAQGFLISKENNRIESVICCMPEIGEVAWIRFFACQRGLSYNHEFIKLLSSLIPILKERRISSLAAPGLPGWFNGVLETSGFEITSKVVVLEKKSEFVQENASINSSLNIRAVTSADLNELVMIDQSSFPPLWKLSNISLQKAVETAKFAKMAYLDRKAVGYQISSMLGVFSVHLSRLAVIPQYQKQNIATTLLIDLFKDVITTGVSTISVNTQAENYKSLKLYQKLGFRLTGEIIPIFTKMI